MLTVNSLHADPGKETLYLSGTDNEHTVTWDFYCTAGRKSGYWTSIEVPSCWEQQGFGQYNYGRDYRTYGKKFQFADEQGQYRYQFEVPSDWKEKAVYLVFDGSMTDTEVKVNGQLAGPIHQGAFYQFRYDISDKLKTGEPNLLEVKVSKMSANASVNHAERFADYWIFGGIFRPVYLEAYPAEHINRVAISAEADGTFKMDVFPEGHQGKRQLQAEIKDSQGEIVGNVSQEIPSGDSLITLQTQVQNPALWTSESPTLYRVSTYLLDGEDTLSAHQEKFGFRTIEIRQGDGIYVNGTKVKMKGINRHSFWPETGRTLNDSIQVLDARLIKEMNMNAVRMSHYPPDEYFLDVCDSLGLYVLDELGGWQNAYDTEVGERLVKELVIRDVNHPSIIFWSNGNEGGTNPELDDDFLKYDPSKRPVIHAHHRPGNDFNGIDCNHYEDYYSTQKILQDSLIYMPTEFLHAQDDGGAAASLQDFWELMWTSERSGGGFLWAFLDEGVVRTDQSNILDVNRINANDGVVGPHREKEGCFYAIKEIYSPIKIDTDSLSAIFDGKISLENRYHFTNLKDCSFRWQLVNFSSPAAAQPGHQVMQEDSLSGPDIAPLQSGEMVLKLPAQWQNYDGLFLTAYDSFGKEIYTWSWETGKEQRAMQALIARKGTSVSAEETDSTITLLASGIGVSLDKQKGTIVSLSNDSSLPLSWNNGPVLCQGKAEVQKVTLQQDGENQVVEITYVGDMAFARWTMYPSGWLGLEYEYTLTGDYDFMGISFNYPASRIISAKWLGQGPYRVWKNRMQGGHLDVWENAYNDTQTGSAPWQYPEFKGYFADVSWMEFNTAEGKFLMATPDDNLFVRLFDFYGLTGPVSYPELPPGDISFLDGIPPVGSKLATNIDKGAAHYGPSGEKNHVRQTFHHTLYFYFGYPDWSE